MLLQIVQHIENQINNRFIFGSEKMIRLLSIAYLSKGHVLIEGPPGTAKTLCAKLMAEVVSKSFTRIQFTSDLLPGDILGAHIYSPKESDFQFIKGPIFSDFVLADEINRTPPRTQSALLEAMEERQVTSEGKKFKLSNDFFVIATQNPFDFEGTFPLPEAQLDRFLIKIKTAHAGKEVESQVLREISDGNLPPELEKIESIALDWGELEKEIASVTVDKSVIDYISELLSATRSHPNTLEGASIRGGIAILKCAKINALLENRDFVMPDDVKMLAVPTLSHRIKLASEAVVSDIKEEAVVKDIVNSIPFPK